MIKWVSFDLDDTLFNGTLLVEKARRASIKMMARYGLDIDETYALSVLDLVVNAMGSNSQEHFDLLLRRLRNDPKSRLFQKDVEFNKYVQAGIIGYHREKVKHFSLFNDVKKIFKNLRKLGIKISILTDGLPKKQYEKILRLNLHEQVDDIIISDEVGVRKPDPYIFQILLNRIKCHPHEVIYVGDKWDKDVAPAKEAKLYTVLIHRGTKHDPNVTKQEVKVPPHYHANDLYKLLDIIKTINEADSN